MSNWGINEDMARIAADRQERDRAERESRNDAEYDLAVLGFHGRRLQDLLDAAKAQAEVMSEGDVRVRVSYAKGVYKVTR